MENDWRVLVKQKMVIHGWNEYDLADHSGFSKSTINRVFRSSELPSAKVLKGIACAFSVPVQHIIPEGKIPPTVNSDRSIPLLALNDIPHWLSDEPFDIKKWQPFISNSKYNKKTYAYKVTSTDMMSDGFYSYPPGYIVIVDPFAPREPGKRVFTLMDDGRVVFRELQEPAGEYYLVALNDKFPMIPEGKNARHLGTVVCSIHEEF